MIKIIGLVIIVASFAFVLKSPDKSLMDRLMERKRTKGFQDTEEAEETNSPDSPQN